MAAASEVVKMEEAIAERVTAAVAAAMAQLQVVQPPPPPQQAAAINTVAVKLPDFWVKDPDLWFYQAECAFRRSRITTSHTMFEYVVMRLPEAVSVSVRALLLSVSPQTVDPYEQLKAALSASFGKTRWQRAFELLDHPEIGDRRPSRMMADMLALLPVGATADTVFLALFLRRLPSSMRDHLAAADLDTPEAMATHADLLWDARSAGSVSNLNEDTVAAVSGRSSSPRDSRRSPDRRRPQRGRGGQGSQGNRPRQQTPGRLCKLHKRWGADAHNCWPPCSWSAEN
jgi:hypothetical protein